MAFALEENEELSVAVTRIAVEQIDLALEHLNAASEDLNKSIHATRQGLKRIRALLTLARGELGDKVFEREWACYRSAGRLLAGARDATVIVETFDALIGRFSSELSADAFAKERRFLVERRETRLKTSVEEEKALEKAGEMIASARKRVASWPVKRAGFKAIRPGLQRSYRAGREGLRSVVRHPSPTNFHEWRRPVKMLWHELQILTPIWPIILNAYADELHSLSDRLNENHDLDVLRHAALWSELKTQPGHRQTLVRFVERRCRQLEAEALPLGRRLYSERPSVFTDRLESFWKTWRHLNSGGATDSDSKSQIAVSTGPSYV